MAKVIARCNGRSGAAPYKTWRPALRRVPRAVPRYAVGVFVRYYDITRRKTMCPLGTYIVKDSHQRQYRKAAPRDTHALLTRRDVLSWLRPASTAGLAGIYAKMVLPVEVWQRFPWTTPLCPAGGVHYERND
jgi:excinuclease UvrABC helicase subunit UvrB